MAVKSRKRSGFAIYLYFKDPVFTLFRQLAWSHEDLSSTDSFNCRDYIVVALVSCAVWRYDLGPGGA